MPRLIFKCPYLKPGAKKSRGGFAKYIATRDGVEKLPMPARGGYAGYMAMRQGSHGLFGADDAPLVLSKVVEEISAHPGNVWAPIISLRREDAVRLGFDSADSWRQLAMAHADELAAALKISPNNFVWYGAFHNEGDHPHMHMLCYSKSPREGFLTEKGIENIKSALARDIFQNDLLEIYQAQTQTRQDAGDMAREALLQAIVEMQGGAPENESISILMRQLVEKLQTYKGKMVYGYLPKPAKAIVNAIVDELAAEPRVADAYAKWCALRQGVAASYSDATLADVPLSQNETFKPVRNMVVKEAAALLSVFADMKTGQNGTDDVHHLDTATSADLVPPPATPHATPAESTAHTSTNASILAASARLVGSIGKIFETAPVYKKVPPVRLDHKRRKELLQKKGGKGIEQADLEQEQGMGR